MFNTLPFSSPHSFIKREIDVLAMFLRLRINVSMISGSQQASRIVDTSATDTHILSNPSATLLNNLCLTTAMCLLLTLTFLLSSYVHSFNNFSMVKNSTVLAHQSDLVVTTKRLSCTNLSSTAVVLTTFDNLDK